MTRCALGWIWIVGLGFGGCVWYDALPRVWWFNALLKETVDGLVHC